MSSILVSSEEDEDGSIDCIVRELEMRGGRFFLVRTGKEGLLRRDFLTKGSNNAIAAVFYKGSHLVTLGRRNNSAWAATKYSLNVLPNGMRNVDGVSIGQFTAKADHLHIIPNHDSLIVLAFSRKEPAYYRKRFQIEQ